MKSIHIYDLNDIHININEGKGTAETNPSHSAKAVDENLGVVGKRT